MRILTLAFRNPLLQINGTSIRTYNIARLVARKHEVDLFFVDLDPVDAKPMVDTTIFGRISAHQVSWVRRAVNIASSIVRKKPIQLNYFQCSDAQRWIRQNKDYYDAALCFHIRMMPYLDDFAGWRVLDMIDATSLLYNQGWKLAPQPWKTIYTWEQEKLRQTELQALTSFNRILISSAYDREYLLKQKEGLSLESITVCPNGVDDRLLQLSGSETTDSIVFVGTMSYPPNSTAVIHFCKECWPTIHRAKPWMKFFIVGHSPPLAVRMLNRIDGVYVTGFVNNHHDYLRRAVLVISPLTFATGIQNKVLEAMAAGKPVVVSPVAIRGINGKSGIHYIVAASSEEFIRAVIDLLNDRTRCNIIGAAARDLIRQKYRWDLHADIVHNALVPPHK